MCLVLPCRWQATSAASAQAPDVLHASRPSARTLLSPVGSSVHPTPTHARTHYPSYTRSTFGVAAISGNWNDHWVFWFGPYLGAIAAALVYNYLFLHEDAVKEQEAAIASAEAATHAQHAAAAAAAAAAAVHAAYSAAGYVPSAAAAQFAVDKSAPEAVETAPVAATPAHASQEWR